MLKKNLLVICLFYSFGALAFDLEDYATTYRATRDAYLKAANEARLASGPHKAARDAYVNATKTYTKTLTSGKSELDQARLAERTRVCFFSSTLDRDMSKDKVQFGGWVPDYLPDVDENNISSTEEGARQEYWYALREREGAGKALAGAVQAYKKATITYVNSLSVPEDMTLIKRTEILNKK